IGVSAYRGKNIADGALGRFLAAAKAGKIKRGSYLLVESLDRLSRQEIQKSLRIFLDIIDAGINIVTLIDNHVYTAEKLELTDFMISLVAMSRANEENETKSTRISAVWAHKRNNAKTEKMTRIAPSWLRLNDKRQFEVIKERAKIVRSIFEDST